MTKLVYTVRWTKTASELLTAIADQRVQRELYARAGQLSHSPEQQGKPLLGELAGIRSLRAVGHRIVYRVERQEVIVLILAVGRRKHGDRRDIYALARKLLRQGLLR